MKDELKQATGERPSLDRRAFLRRASFAAAPLLMSANSGLRALAQQAGEDKALTTSGQAAPGLILRQKTPENLEFPFYSLNSFLTPNDKFYIRSHFNTPTLEAKTWRLKIEGAVSQTLEISYDDLRKMPSRTVTATLECAGNSRVFLAPAARGVQWELGAVSNATWTGVPLAAVLERAGLQPGSVEVIMVGADAGEIKDPPRPGGVINFSRSLPLTKAQLPDVLLAYQMNGADLPVSHGFPVRAVVPGWYGMASVKWLTRLVVTAKPYQGYFQSVDYAYWERQNGLPTRIPLAAMEVKSAIARPAAHEVVAANKTYRVFGAAWAGESDIARVEISTDGGRTWADARLNNQSVRYAWRFWEYDWRTPSQSGRTVLMSRATDSRGRVQPLERDNDRENYMISHLLPVEVDVR